MDNFLRVKVFQKKNIYFIFKPCVHGKFQKIKYLQSNDKTTKNWVFQYKSYFYVKYIKTWFHVSK